MFMWQVWRAQNNIGRDESWSRVRTDLAETPPMSETTGPTPSRRRHVRNVTRSRPTARRAMPSLSRSSGMWHVSSRTANGERDAHRQEGTSWRRGEGVISYLHPRRDRGRRVTAIHRLSLALTLATGYTRVVARCQRGWPGGRGGFAKRSAAEVGRSREEFDPLLLFLTLLDRFLANS